MRILILGGTHFIGRHIADALLSRGHRVSILNRGRSPDPLPVEVERLRGDRDRGLSGLSAIEGRTWDACIDVCGYLPRQVRASAELLHGAICRYVFVSAVRVYGDPADRPVRETHPLVAPPPVEVTTVEEIDDETYGPLKVACERIVHETYGDRATVLRPQVVAGPHDTSRRLTFWLDLAAAGGGVRLPGDGTDHLQFVDARDLGRFAARTVEKDLAGAFNLSGPRFTWSEFARMLGVDEPEWMDAERLRIELADHLRRANLSPQSLPLFRPEHGRLASLMHVSSERAQAAGLTLTPSAETISDTLVWRDT